MRYPRRLPPLQALRAFEAAARHLSFRQAADELAVTPTAISHQVRLLERTLETRLFERRVRTVLLTEAGSRLYPVLREGFDAFARTVADFHPQGVSRAVTLTATTLFTSCRLIPELDRFRRKWPDFELRLHATDEVVDLTKGIADVAVRYGPGPFTDCRSEPLCQERFGVVCSPSLGLRSPGDLSRVTLIHSEWRRRELQPDWRKWCKAAEVPLAHPEAGPRFTDESHAIQAAVAGLGAAIASLVLIEDYLQKGLLVQPFGPILEGSTYYLVTTAEPGMRDEVLAVEDWLKEIVGPSGD